MLASNRVHGPEGGTASAGRLALVQLGSSGRGGDGRARIVRAIGRPDVARDAIEAMMLDRGLARGFDPAVMEAAERARDHGLDTAVHEVGEGRGRRDLRALPTLTIDPASARDYDDAISAERLSPSGGVSGEGVPAHAVPDGGGAQGGAPEGGVRVWVHIADVSAYVPEGSVVDREARRRATSVYVPGSRRADAAAAAVQRRLLAACRARARGGHRRDGPARSGGRASRASTAR